MDERLMISIVAGIIEGVLSLVVSVLVLRYYKYRSASGIDLDMYYDDLDRFKRDFESANGDEVQDRIPVTLILLLYSIVIAIVMAVVVRAILYLELAQSIPIMLLVWLSLTAIPLWILVIRQARQLAILEIATIIEQVATSQDEQGEAWVVRSIKKVFGGDIFGDEEQDTLDVLICRTDAAPVTVTAKGHVSVAQAGLDRTVRKNSLRQLRLKGWFVNEILETEADIEHAWSLRDNTFVEIARDLARVVEALGFSLKNIRVSQTMDLNSK